MSKMSEPVNRTDPTIAELNLAILELINRFEDEGKLHSIILFLYENFTGRKVSRQEIVNKDINVELRPIYLQEEGLEDKYRYLCEPRTKGEIHILHSERFVPLFKNEYDKMMFFEKELVAQVFVSQGYGIHVYRHYVQKRGLTASIEVNENRYKSITASFVTDTYRRIERFLNECGYETIKNTRIQTRNLYTILLNCRKLFYLSEVFTFLKFTCLVFDENCFSVEVTKEEAIVFYERSRVLLAEKLERERNKSVRHDDDYHQSEAPTEVVPKRIPVKVEKRNKQRMEEDNLIDLYINDPRIAPTKDKYKSVYGYNPKFCSISGVQSVVFKQTRKAIRMIQNIYSTHEGNLPPLEELTDYKVKRILSNGQAAQLRSKLLHFLRKGNTSISVMKEMIDTINEYERERDDYERNNPKPGTKVYYDTYLKNTYSKEEIANIRSRKEIIPFEYIDRESFSRSAVIDPYDL